MTANGHGGHTIHVAIGPRAAELLRRGAMAAKQNTGQPATEPSTRGEPESAETLTQATAEPTPLVYTPPIDIHESAEGLVLEADLPGVTEENINIQLEDNVLTLNARARVAVPEGARLIHEEFRVGDFSRSFILSDEVDRDRISADLRNGVLRLTLPKTERGQARRIAVKSN